MCAKEKEMFGTNGESCLTSGDSVWLQPMNFDLYKEIVLSTLLGIL